MELTNPSLKARQARTKLSSDSLRQGSPSLIRRLLRERMQPVSYRIDLSSDRLQARAASAAYSIASKTEISATDARYLY